jgi:hypothetical protein
MGKLTAPISMAGNFRQRWNSVLFRATTALSVSLGECDTADVFGESDDGFKTVQGASCAIRPLEPWRPQPHPRVLQRSLDSAVRDACLRFECGEGPPGLVGAGEVRDDLLSRQTPDGGQPHCCLGAGCRTGHLPRHLSHQRQRAARTLRLRGSYASHSGGRNSTLFAGRRSHALSFRRERPAHDCSGEQVDGEGDIDEPRPRGHVKSVTQVWFGRGAVHCRFSMSPARRPFLVGIVVMVFRPRTSPFMPSSRMRRSTLCLDTPGNPDLASHAVIFRRPYNTSGRCRPRPSRSRRAHRTATRAASSIVRADGARRLQARHDRGATATPC